MPADLIFQLGWDTSRCHSLTCFIPVGARREFRALLVLLWLGFSELFVLSVAWIFRAIGISLWLGVPSYLYFAVAWSSELFVFRCGLEFRAICISLWLGPQTDTC